MIKLLCKLSENAQMPFRGSEKAAGYDLTATAVHHVTGTNLYVYDTNLAVKIPDGHFGLITNRSSIYRTDLQIQNGIIDEDYIGNVRVFFHSTVENPRVYKVGERIAQLIVIPYANLSLEEAAELPQTKRGTNGFGSTGTGVCEVRKDL